VEPCVVRVGAVLLAFTATVFDAAMSRRRPVLAFWALFVRFLAFTRLVDNIRMNVHAFQSWSALIQETRQHFSATRSTFLTVRHANAVSPFTRDSAKLRGRTVGIACAYTLEVASPTIVGNATSFTLTVTLRCTWIGKTLHFRRIRRTGGPFR